MNTTRFIEKKKHVRTHIDSYVILPKWVDDYTKKEYIICSSYRVRIYADGDDQCSYGLLSVVPSHNELPFKLNKFNNCTIVDLKSTVKKAIKEYNFKKIYGLILERIDVTKYEKCEFVGNNINNIFTFDSMDLKKIDEICDDIHFTEVLMFGEPTNSYGLENLEINFEELKSINIDTLL